MEQKLLPPRLFQIGMVLIVTLDVVLGERPILASGPVFWIGVLLAITGAIITVGGAGQFSRRETNINTFLKPDHLVTDGLFAWSRNPMYLGFAAVLTGTALLMGSGPGLIVAAGFVMIADRWYIRFEEQIMAETFGAAYEAYRQKTRRWL
jgi:protein-S-isoprenylcysteine O-methyltransferase Ste14|tara:strand:- start:75944 stop:76393 length:450 start_codon:yes stop_codon:yes gene_type:complete